MNRDTAVSRIKQRLRRVNDTLIDSRIVSEMQDLQKYELENAPTLPWFLLSEDLTVTTDIDEERVQVPKQGAFVRGDFLREFEEGALWVVDPATGVEKEIVKDFYDDLTSTYPRGSEAEKGMPRRYSLVGDYFILKPTPDKEYTVRIKAYLRDQILSTNIENLWLAHAADLMIAEVSHKIAEQHLQDYELAKMIEKDRARARDRLFLLNEARKHANQSYEMGDP